MYQSYQKRERLSRRALSVRLFLALMFLLSFGFAGGVLFLLLFMVPAEQWLVDRGTSQNAIDVILAVLTVGWIAFGLVTTAFYSRVLLRRRNLLAAIWVSCASLVAACVVFFFLLDNDLMVAAGQLGQQSVESDERLTFGPYPDAQKMEELKEQGYDGVITLLNPTIPFEKVLLKEEMQNGKAIGIPVYSQPMLPWVSNNRESLNAVKRLVSQQDKRFYIHCYLGKHRVDLVRRELDLRTGAQAANEPLPSELERGRIETYDGERIILGPYPTDDEWLDVVVRRDVEEIVSTLEPTNPQDVPWIKKEKRIAENNNIAFTLRPLDPDSPDPATVREIARYARGLDHRVYVHDFLDSKRLEALESALQEQTSGNQGTATSGD